MQIWGDMSEMSDEGHIMRRDRAPPGAVGISPRIYFFIHVFNTPSYTYIWVENLGKHKTGQNNTPLLSRDNQESQTRGSPKLVLVGHTQK